jgi:hypothetical protein
MPKRVVRFTDEQRLTVIDMASKGKSDFEISRFLTESGDINITKRMLQYRCGTELKIGHKKAIEDGVNLPQVGKMTSNEGITEFSPEMRFQIGEMAGLGLRNDQIALILGVGKQTMVAYCQDDIDKGRARAHETVTKTLFAMATDGEHPNETKFYLKAQCGWKEATQVEFPDENGRPQSITSPGVSINLSADKMQALIAILNEQV